jgi:hypothetical protein
MTTDSRDATCGTKIIPRPAFLRQMRARPFLYRAANGRWLPLPVTESRFTPEKPGALGRLLRRLKGRHNA